MEQLEKELGCPVDVIKKALKDGIYFNGGKLINLYIAIEYDEYEKKYEGTFIGEVEEDGYIEEDVDILVRDYKKYWWLKEDKSE